MKLRIFTLFLSVLMLLSFASCGQKADTDPNNTTGSTASGPIATTPNNPSVPEQPTNSEKTNVYVLSGTTGFGMGQMMNQDATGAAKYTFNVKADASDVTAALINGDADIAALPTNAAANVYNKTNGGVKIIAINTLGVLYMVTTDGTTISSFEQLRGKTVYAPAQNPTFIFQYLCQANGLNVGTDITIDSTSYAAPANLRDAVAAGAVDIAILPEPMVTIATNAAKTNNVTVTNTMDLTAEWNKVAPAGSLVQGCVVVRTSFLNQYPGTVSKFLEEYEASINFTNSNPEQASQYIAQAGVFANANVAKAAIPKCNICYLDGEEMKSAMANYLNILFGIAPNSVGGKLPLDDFYYIPA